VAADKGTSDPYKAGKELAKKGGGFTKGGKPKGLPAKKASKGSKKPAF
jgi:hypothetical protein